MAVKIRSNPSTFNEHPRQISRQGAWPWERESLFFSLGTPNDTGVDTAYGYAKNSPIAYVGQPISVVDHEHGIVNYYQIMDEAGTLREIGATLLSSYGEYVEDADENELGWAGSKIKDYVKYYCDNFGGGGGSYVPSTASFAGIGTMVVESGKTYNITTLILNITSPNLVASDVVIEATQNAQKYYYTIPKASVKESNTLAIPEFYTASGTSQLSISGVAQGNYARATTEFMASYTDNKGNVITCTGTNVIKSANRFYAGVQMSTTVTPSSIVSLSNKGNMVTSDGGTFSIDVNTANDSYIILCIPDGKTLRSVIQDGLAVVTDSFSLIGRVENVSYEGSLQTTYACYTSAKQAANNIKLSVTIG